MKSGIGFSTCQTGATNWGSFILVSPFHLQDFVIIHSITGFVRFGWIQLSTPTLPNRWIPFGYPFNQEPTRALLPGFAQRLPSRLRIIGFNPPVSRTCSLSRSRFIGPVSPKNARRNAFGESQEESPWLLPERTNQKHVLPFGRVYRSSCAGSRERKVNPG